MIFDAVPAPARRSLRPQNTHRNRTETRNRGAAQPITDRLPFSSAPTAKFEDALVRRRDELAYRTFMTCEGAFDCH